MKSIMTFTKLKFKSMFWGAVLVFLSVPVFFANATSHPNETPDPNDKNQTPDLPPEPTDDFSRLKNPLKSIDNIPDFVQSLLDIVLTIGIPIVALAIIYSGFLFVSAQGSPDKLKKAREAFTYTIIGAAILLGAVVLAQAIGGTVNELRGA